jgi:CRISPR/Cas system CSM-associated protein Csm4 (group 5 of RAMP superfamily)
VCYNELYNELIVYLLVYISLLANEGGGQSSAGHGIQSINFSPLIAAFPDQQTLPALFL